MPTTSLGLSVSDATRALIRANADCVNGGGGVGGSAVGSGVRGTSVNSGTAVRSPCALILVDNPASSSADSSSPAKKHALATRRVDLIIGILCFIQRRSILPHSI
jgi:hypothetical protein